MIFSFIEILIVLLPILLVVAYVTLLERKVLGSMQRRVGPDTVGNIYAKKSSVIVAQLHKRNYTTESTKLNSEQKKTDSKQEAVQILYKNRSEKLFPNGKWNYFDKNLIKATLFDVTNLTEKLEFFSKFKNKGGIYLFQYKNDLSVYYIGRTKNFYQRFNKHLNSKHSDRFHLFANLVGWYMFHYSIIEVCDITVQKKKENFYLKKFLPLLNTSFKSTSTKDLIYESLHDKLKIKQKEINKVNKHKGIKVYLYYLDNFNEIKSLNFDSINALSTNIRVSRETISKYINTDVPFKNNFFYTYLKQEFDNKDTVFMNNLITTAMNEFNLHYSIPKQVFAYKVHMISNSKALLSGENIKIKCLKFKSIEAAADYFKVYSNTIKNHINQYKGGITSEKYYLFSKPITKDQKKYWINIQNKRKQNNIQIWVYNVNKLTILFSLFKSIKKTADFFKVDYRKILSFLDTDIAFYSETENEWYLFYSLKLTLEKQLKLNSKGSALMLRYPIKYTQTPIWVYENINGKKIKLGDKDRPCFTSITNAANQLKMSHKTINKYLNSHNCYKNFYFYSYSYI